jgi:death on curing protein
VDSLSDLLAINGEWIRAPEDDRFEIIVQVAAGTLADLDKIAGRLRAWSYREG